MSGSVLKGRTYKKSRLFIGQMQFLSPISDKKIQIMS